MAKNEEKSCSTCLKTPFYGWFRVPENQILGTRSATNIRHSYLHTHLLLHFFSIFSSLCDRFSIVVNLPNLMSLFSNSQVRNCIAGFGLNTQLQLPPTSPSPPQTSHSIWLFIMKTDFHFSSPLNGFNCIISFYWRSATASDVFKMKWNQRRW